MRFSILYMICSWLGSNNKTRRKEKENKHWYGPSIFKHYNERKLHLFVSSQIWNLDLHKGNCASTEDRLPPANHPLQRCPTWASTVCTGDKVFRTAGLLRAPEAEVAVAIGDHWTVRRFLGWRKKKKREAGKGKSEDFFLIPSGLLDEGDEPCKLISQCYEMLPRSEAAELITTHWDRSEKESL